jgi:alkanesulfonate monooxygenase SsuD/methylene tetrahydromethanopterin reductase-like flavin-dependent oxidoreductase (luciferase family)
MAIMRHGLDVPTIGAFATPATLAQLAQLAESCGWDGVFVWDVSDGLDVWCALEAIVSSTRHVRIGTMVLALARHDPHDAARRLAELDRRSGGRLVVGVGLGHRAADFAALGLAEGRARARRLDEALGQLDQHWRDALIGPSGGPAPLQRPRPPIWIAGGWPHRAPLERAARWDGLALKSIDAIQRTWLSHEQFVAAVAYVRSWRTAAAPFDIIASGDTSGPRAAAVARLGALQAAGATWWIEEGLGWSDVEFAGHIALGPPRATPA